MNRTNEKKDRNKKLVKKRAENFVVATEVREREGERKEGIVSHSNFRLDSI